MNVQSQSIEFLFFPTLHWVQLRQSEPFPDAVTIGTDSRVIGMTEIAGPRFEYGTDMDVSRKTVMGAVDHFGITGDIGVKLWLRNHPPNNSWLAYFLLAK